MNHWSLKSLKFISDPYLKNIKYDIIANDLK